jgi:hypothetical protein
MSRIFEIIKINHIDDEIFPFEFEIIDTCKTMEESKKTILNFVKYHIICKQGKDHLDNIEKSIDRFSSFQGLSIGVENGLFYFKSKNGQYINIYNKSIISIKEKGWVWDSTIEKPNIKLVCSVIILERGNSNKNIEQQLRIVSGMSCLSDKCEQQIKINDFDKCVGELKDCKFKLKHIKTIDSKKQ